MSYATLPIHQNQLTLPTEWLKAFPADTAAAAWLGDVLVIRPITSVRYSPEAEERVLRAVSEFDEAKQKGEIFELGDKTFDDLMQEADKFS